MKPNSIISLVVEFFDSNKDRRVTKAQIAAFVADKLYKNKMTNAYTESLAVWRAMKQVDTVLYGRINHRCNWKKVGRGVFKYARN